MSYKEDNQFLKEFHANPLRPRVVLFLQNRLQDLRDEHENSPVGNEVTRGKIQEIKDLLTSFNKE